jgi:hypothetical protein
MPLYTVMTYDDKRRSGEFRPLDLSDLSTRSRLCRGKSLAGCLDSGYHPRGSRT